MNNGYWINKRVRIRATDNPFAKAHVGKTGTVKDFTPDGRMVVVHLDGESATDPYWANTYNLSVQL